MRKLPPARKYTDSNEEDDLYLWQAMRSRRLKDCFGEDSGSLLANKFVDRFLRTLAQHPPEEWSDESWEIIKSCTREFGDVFWERLASGTTDKRRLKPPPQPRGIPFLRDNWKALCVPKRDNPD